MFNVRRVNVESLNWFSKWLQFVNYSSGSPIRDLSLRVNGIMSLIRGMLKCHHANRVMIIFVQHWRCIEGWWGWLASLRLSLFPIQILHMIKLSVFFDLSPVRSSFLSSRDPKVDSCTLLNRSTFGSVTVETAFKGLVINYPRDGSEDKVLGHDTFCSQFIGSQHKIPKNCWVGISRPKMLNN